MQRPHFFGALMLKPSHAVLALVLACAPLLSAHAAPAVPYQGKPLDTITMSSGIRIEIFEKGGGRTPRANSTVRVNYLGRLQNGAVFDSSFARGEPVTLALNEVISCWRVALQQVAAGSRVRILCPAHTAYGGRGAGPIPPDANLTFDVELLAAN